MSVVPIASTVEILATLFKKESLLKFLVYRISRDHEQNNTSLKTPKNDRKKATE
jgi:hypothetical protein